MYPLVICKTNPWIVYKNLLENRTQEKHHMFCNSEKQKQNEECPKYIYFQITTINDLAEEVQ